ncbi:MAG: hypothetical protein IKT07_11540 [Oscillospiraceae bacterium]|nr:hypothetical protein [Oscillospiraceae bacterium]
MNLTQTELNPRPSLDIPWMRRWEKNERAQSTTIDDPQTRMVNIDYMTMLEELEFH